MTLYDDLDVRATIDTIYRYHKNNKLAIDTGGDYRYDVDLDRAEDCAKALRRLGFTGGFFSGVTKICFPHKKSWVVKVPILKAWSPLFLAEVAIMTQAPRHSAYFPTSYIFEKGRYMFQEKCVLPKNMIEVPDTLIQAAKKMGLRDIHEDNVGKSIATGQWKIIDLQTSISLASVRGYQRGRKVVA